MRRIIFTTFCALAVAAASASADMSSSTTTSTTYSGTISSMTPSSSTIVLKTEKASEPTQYVYTEKTAWVDASGATVSREAVQNQPVTLYTEKQGDKMVVTKVVTQSSAPATKIEKKTTTTTTTEGVE